ncbi:hypothetical protein PoB_002658200 [Plakobranchus ocellatus]|uniref:Uncharacterized protein n=1 Tax=Plakobranchus ocellatus TaxID=259542 RepID=A0AAV3ZZG9_9GAST|nr:hypothetical protein PoB_002658200 [Plakobranchus ocellatus]
MAKLGKWVSPEKPREAEARKERKACVKLYREASKCRIIDRTKKQAKHVQADKQTGGQTDQSTSADVFCREWQEGGREGVALIKLTMEGGVWRDWVAMAEMGAGTRPARGHFREGKTMGGCGGVGIKTWAQGPSETRGCRIFAPAKQLVGRSSKLERLYFSPRKSEPESNPGRRHRCSPMSHFGPHKQF